MAAIHAILSATKHYQLLLLMLLTMLMSGLAAGQQRMCTSSNLCTCYGSELMDCGRKNLRSVPTFLPNNITYDKLLLSHNSIEVIGQSAFTGIQFRKLEIIGNPLKIIDEAAFSGLELTLTEINMRLDGIRAEFPDQALKRLQKLTTLEIADFAHSKLPDGALSGLRTLRELRLTPGSLEILTASDLADERSTLEILDISDNRLREFPTDAIRTLFRLKVLNARANQFDHLDGKFVVSSSLEELIISQHALNRGGINASAFIGVNTTLRRLDMSQCHLQDRHVPAITKAAAVTDLVVSYNELTSVKSFLSEMHNLVRLDAHNNSITTLTTRTLPLARQLRALNLAYNPLTNVDADAFVNLLLLQDLKLDSKTAMPLDESSFASQRSTLRNLSLRGVDLSRPQWSVVADLQGLEMLSLSNCRLGNIPPFTFHYTGWRLHTLELAHNYIDEMNQTALVGLESSLDRLNLDSNRLSTIEHCTFYRFAKLQPIKLSLNNNSLICNCRLEWLYRWTNNTRIFLNWRCSDGRLFKQLTGADFEHCNTTDDEHGCEDFVLTTPSTGLQPRINLFVVNVTSKSFTVRWTVDADDLSVISSGFRVNCSCVNSWSNVDITVREYRFDGLDGGTTYGVCVSLIYLEVFHNWTAEMDDTSCLNVSTTWWLSDPVVMTVVITGAVLSVVVLVLSIGIGVAVRRWRVRRRIRLAEQAQPKIAGRTKRFMRQQRPQSLDATANDRLYNLRFQSRSVETNLDTLQEDGDERYKTLIRLARSLDNLVDNPTYFLNQLESNHGREEQEVYDEINEELVDFDGCRSPLVTEESRV